jgi:hypothetical protein
MEDATISEKTGYGVPPKEYQFKPGQSGNPSGRPKDTLKAFVATKFREMNDDEKMLWLENNKVAAIDQWKMAEGNPKTDTEITARVAITGLSEEDKEALNLLLNA